MSHRPKSSFTLPRRNELHTSAPQKYLTCRNRIEFRDSAQGSESGTLSIRKEFTAIYKEETQSRPKLKSRATYSSDGEEDDEDDEEEDEEEEEEGDEDEEADSLHAELYKCFEHLNELMPSIQIDEEQITKIEERHSSRVFSSVQTSVDCKPLHSHAALNHAKDRVLAPCQQQKLEPLNTIGIIRTIGERNTLDDMAKVAKLSATISVAQQLSEQHKRRMTASEIVLMSLRNFWFDNMELKIGDSFMHVDRYLFQYFSQTFADHHNFYLELPSHKVPMKLMAMVYQWLIGEHDEEFVLDANYLAVYSLAKFLDIRRLLEQFWYTFSLSEKFGFWEQSAFHAYLKAREELTQIPMPCGDMMAILLGRVRKCFLPLVASLEFLQLNVHEVIFVLKMESICVNSEDEMFFVAVRWLAYDWLKRKKYLVDIMSTIRMRLLSPWLQRSIVYKPENSVIRCLGSNIYVRRMLWDACLFGTVNQTVNQHSEDLNKVLKARYNPDVIMQRIWIFCPGVPHHHDIKCSRHRQLTYETFKLFLVSLQTRSQYFIDSMKYSPQKHWATYECCSESDSERSVDSKKVIPSIYSKRC